MSFMSEASCEAHLHLDIPRASFLSTLQGRVLVYPKAHPTTVIQSDLEEANIDLLEKIEGQGADLICGGCYKGLKQGELVSGPLYFKTAFCLLRRGGKEGYLRILRQRNRFGVLGDYQCSAEGDVSFGLLGIDGSYTQDVRFVIPNRTNELLLTSSVRSRLQQSIHDTTNPNLAVTDNTSAVIDSNISCLSTGKQPSMASASTRLTTPGPSIPTANMGQPLFPNTDTPRDPELPVRPSTSKSVVESQPSRRESQFTGKGPQLRHVDQSPMGESSSGGNPSRSSKTVGCPSANSDLSAHCRFAELQKLREGNNARMRSLGETRKRPRDATSTEVPVSDLKSGDVVDFHRKRQKQLEEALQEARRKAGEIVEVLILQEQQRSQKIQEAETLRNRGEMTLREIEKEQEWIRQLQEQIDRD